MTRYDERSPRLIDLVARFESKSSADHAYNAYAAIQRLRDDGATLWAEGTDQRNRWNKGCTTLLEYLRKVYQEQETGGDWTTVFREFLQEFEHATQRMLQLLHSSGVEEENPQYIDDICSWIEFTYRLSTYAMISRWIDDKTAERTVQITVDLASGTSTEEWNLPPLRVPPQYRSSTRPL